MPRILLGDKDKEVKKKTMSAFVRSLFEIRICHFIA